MLSGIADGGQVEARVPVQQFLLVAGEQGDLAGGEADSEQVVGILGKLFHRRVDYT